jgi:hypothetical protein
MCKKCKFTDKNYVQNFLRCLPVADSSLYAFTLPAAHDTMLSDSELNTLLDSVEIPSLLPQESSSPSSSSSVPAVDITVLLQRPQEADSSILSSSLPSLLDADLNLLLDSVDATLVPTTTATAVVPLLSPPVYINASDLSSLLGMHPFKSQATSFLDLLQRRAEWRDEVNSARALWGVGSADAAIAAALEQSGMKETLATAVAASTSLASAASGDAEVAAAIAQIAKVTSETAAVIGAQPAAAAAMVAAAVQSVMTARGTALETIALDELSTLRGVPLTDRNAAMVYVRRNEWVLGGRIDGFIAATQTAVEVKNRMRARHIRFGPPTYDVLQTRVYVTALRENGIENATGELLERFPDGTSRSTSIPHDQREWELIEKAIELTIVNRVRGITKEVISDLARQVAEAEEMSVAPLGHKPVVPHSQ